MIKKLSLVFLILVAFLAVSAGVSNAQSYTFRVTKEVVNAEYNQDGTLSLDYVFDFANDAGGHIIDYVDLGLPYGSYDLNSVSADVNGSPVMDISKADPQNLSGGSYGVTVGLGSLSIPPGGTGTVHIHVGTINRVLFPYQYNNIQNYVSTNFWPAYFTTAHGNTDMTVSIHLPPGIQPQEPIYYQPEGWPGASQPQAGLDDQGRVVYTWSSQDANAYTQYKFGAGFPDKYIPASAIVRQPQIQFAPENLFCLCIVLIIALVFGFSIYNAIWGARKRKLQYLPPKISIEGHGIKRGLTAVEAAILEEQPMDKIMTMILFGVIKKGAAAVVTREPLELKVVDPLPEGLNPYEVDFLTAFRDTKGVERRKGLQDMMIKLVQSISEKMKGFSRKETIAYYEDITKRAWEQVEAANTPEVKGQKYDEVLDWTMLDRHYDDRTRRTFGSGPVFVPIWWGNYDPVFRSHMGSAPSTPSIPGGKVTVNLPNLPGADFAASMVNGVQSFAAGAIGDLTAFTGGITNKTNPVPVATSSGRYTGGGGGGHCACACACACAGCACACAGGGR